MTAATHDPRVAHGPGYFDLDCAACSRAYDRATDLPDPEPVTGTAVTLLDWCVVGALVVGPALLAAVALLAVAKAVRR